MPNTSSAQMRASAKYHGKFDVIQIRVPKDGGLKEKIAAHAAARGESTTQFLVRAARSAMQRDLAGD